MSNTIIRANGLSKTFNTDKGDGKHHALQNVSFELQKGDSMAVVGKNGSGKSTLLKILSAVYKPTTGNASIKGKIASILEVGTGFHPDLSGYENVFFHGELMGFKRNEIRGKLDEIIAFSGIEEFINEPVKTYSNGMFVRLASAVVVTLSYDVLILDEVIGMGDAQFRMQFSEKLGSLTAGGTTVIMASHNVNELFGCNVFMWLEDGMVRSLQNDDKVLIQYLESSARRGKAVEGSDYTGSNILRENNIEINGLKLSRLTFCNNMGVPQAAFDADDEIYLDISVVVTKKDCPFALMFALVNEFNTMVIGTSYNLEHADFRTPAVGTELNFRAHFPGKTLNFGNYYLDVYGYDEAGRIRNLGKHLLSFNIKGKQVQGFNLRGSILPGIIQPFIGWELYKTGHTGEE